MPFTSRAAVLGASASLLAASPAAGADTGLAAISATGGTLVVIGLVLIGIGAYALARPRPAAPRVDTLSQASAESAATVVRTVPADSRRATVGAAAAGRHALAYRSATLSIDEQIRQPAYVGTGSPTADSDEVQTFLANARPMGGSGDSMLSDRHAIAEQMLEALKAEQARRAR